MAYLWQHNGSTWTRQPLSGKYFGLQPDRGAPVQPSDALPANGVAAALAHYASREQTPLWALLGREDSAIRVNGRLLPAGITVLHDRDEILIGARTRLYFSTEELAKIEPFPGGSEPAFCARCRQSIQPGTPAVRCPACGHWCEQTDAKPCWTYGPTCPLCEQPTAFDAGLRWTPESL
jgi:hypothetical protein